MSSRRQSGHVEKVADGHENRRVTGVRQPSGTVTLVFTDIEGSTRLLEQLGVDAYRDALAEHRRIVRYACARHDGYEVDCEGDAFFYAFATANDAVAAVREAMSGLEGGPVRIRVGIHTGQPALDEPKYVGMDVHRAARIMSSAHGGQVVLSRETAERLDDGADLKDLGEHRFKDLGAPERLFQLGQAAHARLTSLYRVTLPAPATPFLGRKGEVAEVVARISDPDTRLLTLTGPGGTGKTRLALEAAAEVSEDYPEGVFWVALAPLRDAEYVTTEIAQALELRDHPGEDLTATVAEALLGKKTLLVVDNVEHLLPGAARHFAELLGICPTLRLIVTSRERLRISHETVWPVPGLAADEGEQLFVQRARAAGVEVDSDETVVELCARLDGLPLAIELAAARTTMFSPAAILERLDGRLDLLATGDHDVEERQRTLEATIGWSYDLLDADEQRALRALSIFAGGCTIDAAASVADASVELVGSLLDKSLLRRRLDNGHDRYWMLETIREYAVVRLREQSEEAILRRRHAEWFSNQAAELADGDRAVLLSAEDDNLRLALAFGLAHDTALAVRLCLTLTPYWFYRGRLLEADQWGRALLTSTERDNGDLRADALALAGRFRLLADDAKTARPLLEQALAAFRGNDDQLALARCLADLGAVARLEGRFATAIALLTESVELHRDLDDTAYEATGALHFLGETLRDAGRLDAARECLEEVISRLRDVGAELMAASSTHSLGDLELDAGRPDEAAARYRAALGAFQGEAAEREIANCLGGLASAAAISGEPERAAKLWGAVEAIEERLQLQLFEHERLRYTQHVSRATERCSVSVAEGKGWPLDEAIAFAVDDSPRSDTAIRL
jgi:predicted ATPase/class 3 adenylate cyclase